MLNKFKVVNANYDKVLYYIDKMLSENDRYCRCPHCRMDAAALALNTLPPHYFVDGGYRENKDLGSPWLLIEVAAREAMEKIFYSPNHPPKESEMTDNPLPDTLTVKDTGTEG